MGAPGKDAKLKKPVTKIKYHVFPFTLNIQNREIYKDRVNQ